MYQSTNFLTPSSIEVDGTNPSDSPALSIFANVFFTPMAGKLKRKDEMEMLHKNVIIEGVVSIKQNEHPLIIKEKLMTMVPPDVVLTLQDENREIAEN